VQAVCFFLRIVGSWHLRMSVAERRMKTAFVLCRFPFRDIRILEELHGEAAVKKTQVYEYHKRFRNGRTCEVTVRTADDRQFRQMSD
jgi:hypothetical protein